MSDQTITEREAVLRERKAYMRGYLQASGHMSEVRPVFLEHVETVASSAYPLPKVTRPREALDPVSSNGRRWRVVGGVLETKVPLDSNARIREWHRVDWAEKTQQFVESPVPPTPERVAAWADLFANPTKEVEA